MIDVGANTGQYGTELRTHGYDGRIVSFEPASEAFAELDARRRQDPMWIAQQLALGSASGTATLNIAANEGKSSSFLRQKEFEFGTTATMRYVGTETVEVATLEEIGGRISDARDHVYLKIDVQGLELAVVEGAGAFLSRVLAIEVELALLPLYEAHPDWRAVCDRLEDLGYVFYAVDPGYSDWDSGRLVEMDGLFVRKELAELH